MKNIFSFCFIYLIFITTMNAQTPQNIESSLVILHVKSGKEQVVLKENRHFEAPNWSRDGKYLVINAKGLLEKIGVNGEKLGIIHTDFANQCNNDHGFTFDGKNLIISHNDASVARSNNSRIFIMPAEGGTPRLVTEKFPSYWHGVSPDGQTLLYCAERNNEWDIYSINVNGGAETRLTDAKGLDDGPEYSYDGQWIYFNSNRSGRMHLYRMKPDGAEVQQLTNDDYDNWFAHPSPDGKNIVYIAYLEDQKGSHPFGRDVKLRIMNVKNRKIRDLTPVFYGGQGTINVPSWSPDGKYIAFVRYRKL
ncbi:MAG: TolB family protein [Saprospiraceae bacterium]